MKLGWCSPLEDADLIKETGYDFIEVPLAPLGLEDRATFAASRRAVLNSPLPTSAFNVLFPKDLRIVGPSIDVHRIRNYLARAAELLADAQAQVVVFGSGWARNIPENWSRPQGEDQFLQALSWCADALKGTGVTLAIEPLNRKETNLINSVEEGARYVQQVNRSEIRLLADFYHMDEEQESLETLRTHGEWLFHIHVADSGRRNPGTGTYDYERFFGHLEAIGYAGTISAECEVTRPAVELRHSLSFLRGRLPDRRL
jgi:sugar phosphate isomerase/epimerase